MELDPLLVEFDRRMYALACSEFQAEVDSGFSRITKIKGSETYYEIEVIKRLNSSELYRYLKVLPKRVRHWLIKADSSFFSGSDKVIVDEFLDLLAEFWPQSMEYLRMSEEEVKLEMDVAKKPLARQIRQALAKKAKGREFGFKDHELELISPNEIVLKKQIGRYELSTLVDLKMSFAMSYHSEVTNQTIRTNALAEDFMVTFGIAGPASWRYVNEVEAMESFEHMMGIASYFAKKMETILEDIQALGSAAGTAS